MHRWVPLTLVLGLTSLLAVPVSAQPAAAAENLANKAYLSYQQGLQSLDPALYWDSVNTLTTLFDTFPDTEVARNNHLTAVEICLKKIGGEEGYAAAEDLVRHYLATYPNPNDPDTRDMHLVLVQIAALYRHDYNGAARLLNDYYSTYSGQLRDAELVEVKLLQAMIERKQQYFAGAKISYGLAEQASKRQGVSSTALNGLDLQREIRLCEATDLATHVPSGPHVFHGLVGVTPAQLQKAQDHFAEAWTELALKLGTAPDRPIDILVFPTPERLELLTGSAGVSAQPIEGFLYVLPDTDPTTLLAQVFALAFRVRPAREVPEVLSEGFSAAVDSNGAPWTSAAQQRALLGTAFTPDVILDPERFDVIPDHAALAGTFVDYLLDNYGVPAVGKLYGGWETMTLQTEIAPSRAAAIAEPDRFVRSIDTVAMSRAFRSAVGTELDAVWKGYDAKLQQVARAQRATFEARGGSLKAISVSTTTPEQTVDSWFRALKAGDTEALQKLATKDLAHSMELTWSAFKSAGSFDAVRLWSMAIPYSESVIEVLGRQELGPSQVLIAVKLTTPTQGERQVRLMVYNEDNGWRIASSDG
ncbi:MAG: hypothetical protein ABI743_08875 [bacterium]